MLSPKQFPAAPKRQGPGPPASPRYQADTQRAWLYRAGAPAAAAAASSRCHRLGQTILRIPAPLLTTCRPQSLLPGNQYGQSQVQGERQWRRMWPFSPNADRGSRSRGNRGASRGQRGFAGNLSRHPLRYRKPHPPHQVPSSIPDRLPGVAAALPPPAPAGPACPRRQQLPPAGVSARAARSRPLAELVAVRVCASW